MDLETSYEKCTQLANSHYENFPVAKMVPKRIRKHVAAVYAYARTADDIADEEHENIDGADPKRIKTLEEFESQLSVDDTSQLDNRWSWIFVALANTIKEFNIPKQLFLDLTSAFKQDVVKKRYADFSELLDYCRRSANPVGRLVLLLHGLRSEEMFAKSDCICTALQLANFWQDMSVDRAKGRIYIPVEDWNGLSEADIFADCANSKLKDVLKYEVERTHTLFNRGADLPKQLPFPLSLEIKITIEGGRAILNKIEQGGYNTLFARPKLGKLDKVKLLIKAIL